MAWEMSSSLRAMGWWYVCMLHHRSSCLLVQAMDGCIMHCSISSSCQSAATSEIVKRFWTWVWLVLAALYQVLNLYLFYLYEHLYSPTNKDGQWVAWALNSISSVISLSVNKKPIFTRFVALNIANCLLLLTKMLCWLSGNVFCLRFLFIFHSPSYFSTSRWSGTFYCACA